MKFFKEDIMGWVGLFLSLAADFYISLKHPPLFGTFLSEKELSICYGITFFLWEEMPLIQVCTEMGGLLEFCGHVIVPVLFFAVGFFQCAPLWGVFTAVLWLLSLLWFICVCRHSVARTFHRKGYKAMRVAQEMNRKACIRFGVLMATVFLTVPALLGFFIYRTTDTMTFSVNKSEFANTLDVEQITWDRGISAGILAAGQRRANFADL